MYNYLLQDGAIYEKRGEYFFVGTIVSAVPCTDPFYQSKYPVFDNYKCDKECCENMILKVMGVDNFPIIFERHIDTYETDKPVNIYFRLRA